MLALIGTLVAFVSGSFTLVGELLAPIRAALVLIRAAVASVSRSFTVIGELLALVGETVSFVCATLSFGQSLPRLCAARSIRFRSQLVGRIRPLVTTGRIPTVRRSVAHHSSMRLGSADAHVRRESCGAGLDDELAAGCRRTRSRCGRV
jgi:hypothetical protein